MATATQTAPEKAREETGLNDETTTAENNLPANTNGASNLAEQSPEAQRIAQLAYFYWQARGCPDGSAEQDWFRAEAELQGVSSTANE
jgi:hypothetical protein